MPSSADLDTERLPKPLVPRLGNLHRPGVALSRDPAQLEAPARQCRADPTGEMRPPLAPIQARPAKHPPTRRRRCAEAVEELLPLFGYLAAIRSQCDMTPLGQGISQRHAEPPGQVVVAGAGRTQRLAAAP